MKAQTRKVSATGKIFIFIGVSIIAVYIIIAMYYAKCFFPNTKVNETELGHATVVEAKAILRGQLQDYSLSVEGRDLRTKEVTTLFQIPARDVGLLTDVDAKEISQLLNSQNNLLWPVYIWREYDYHLQGGLSYDNDKLKAILDEQDSFNEKKTMLPTDAYLKAYSAETGEYEIVPEVKGTRLNRKLAEAAITEAISMSVPVVNLDEKMCYYEPEVIASDASMQQMLSQAEKLQETHITYNWNNNEVVLTGDQMQDWITYQNGKFTVEESKVRAFVEENAAKYDTYGKNRVFRTTLGYDLTLPSGSFGWKTDCEAETKELIKLIEQGTVTEREPIYESKAPWKGINDIGNSYVEADLTHQHLYLYKNGTLVFETDFVSGDMSKGYNTPQGVFGLTYKTTNAVLRGADYQENVSYWMPYEGNYGMHDASWRDAFGGDIFMSNGSHGCLNLPVDAAGAIYNQIYEGFPVICYYYPEGVLPAPEVIPEEDDEDD